MAVVQRDARQTFKPLDAPNATAVDLAPWLPAGIRAAHHDAHVRWPSRASLVFTLHLRHLGRQKPARRAGPGPHPRHSAIGADHRLPVVHRRVLHEPVPRPRARASNWRRSSPSSPARRGTWRSAVYQSLKTVPADLAECATAFRLSPWQKFWRMEVPFAMPGLVWNTMMSMSGRLVLRRRQRGRHGSASNTWKLPGIGSYVAEALDDSGDIVAVGYAILAMLVVILAYDQLLFRPLVAWSAKFRFEMTAQVEQEDPWVLKLLRRTRVLSAWLVNALVRSGFNTLTGLRLSRTHRQAGRERRPRAARPDGHWFWGGAGVRGGGGAVEDRDYVSATPELGRPGRGAAARRLHHDPGRRADDLGHRGLGADRRLARAAAEMGAPGAAGGAVPGGVPGQFVFPALRRRSSCIGSSARTSGSRR